MIDGIVFVLKGILLTDVLARALKDWGIFETPRNWVKKKSNFFNKLLECDECVRVWTGFFVILYLIYFEWIVFTYALIFHRAACFINIVWLNADWARANKEQDFQNKLKGGK